MPYIAPHEWESTQDVMDTLAGEVLKWSISGFKADEAPILSGPQWDFVRGGFRYMHRDALAAESRGSVYIFHPSFLERVIAHCNEMKAAPMGPRDEGLIGLIRLDLGTSGTISNGCWSLPLFIPPAFRGIIQNLQVYRVKGYLLDQGGDVALSIQSHERIEPEMVGAYMDRAWVWRMQHPTPAHQPCQDCQDPGSHWEEDPLSQEGEGRFLCKECLRERQADA